MVIIEAAKHPFLLDARFAGTIEIRFISMRVQKAREKSTGNSLNYMPVLKARGKSTWKFAKLHALSPRF